MKISRSELDMLGDPLALWNMWDEDPPYQWQSDVISSIFSGTPTIVTTPNEAGKTSKIVANSGLICMAKYPGCKVVSTAGSFRQVSEQLWPIVRSKVAPFPKWRITEEKLYAPSINGIPGSTWTIFSTDDPKKAEGYHAQRFKDAEGNLVYCPLMYIIDEAKAVESGIFEAAYRCDPDYFLVCSTPGEEDGELYNIIQRIQGRRENE